MQSTFADLGISVRPLGRIEQRVACPQCTKRERDDTLGVNLESGVYHCFRCGWSGRAGGESAETRPVVRTLLDDAAQAARKRQRLQRTWKQTVSVMEPGGRPVKTYLESRGIGRALGCEAGALRAHRSLEYWDGSRLLGEFPAMVALLHGGNDRPVTLHVTYLRANGLGKAAVPCPRKVLSVPVRGATRGGTIRLYAPEKGVLGIAEGIESALSLRELHGFPVWAAYCAGNLEHVRLPPKLRELHIGVDVDESGAGERAARALAMRVQRPPRRARHAPWQVPGLKVTLWYPEIDGPGDLNDELMRKQRRAS